MRKKFCFPFCVVLLFIIACDKESSPVEVGTDPVIEDVQVKQKWNSQSTFLNKVEVKVTDPQGFSNIALVLLEVKSQATNQVVFTDSLFDDGAYFHTNDGDVIAGDGIYSNRFSAVQILSGAADGSYTFSLRALDEEKNESKPEEILVSFGANERPFIVGVSAPDTLFSGTKGQIIQVAVFDNDGIDDVARVYFESEKLGSGNVIPESDLFNDGDFVQHGDLFADDSLYSIKLDSTYGAGKSGNYNLIFHVQDSFGEENLDVSLHPVIIENEVGKILSTTVPDSVEKPVTPGNTTPFELNAAVQDPQGLADIDSVYFLSEKPDGTFSGSGFHFEMKDDGSGQYGDDQANDGEYSIIIEIANSNDSGLYIFHFYMRDKVGHLTSVTKDSITVY